MIVTPFADRNSYSSEQITLGSRNSSQMGQQPLITAEDRVGEIVALHRLSSLAGPTLATPVPLSPPAAPVPVGLSGKQLARLRAEAFASSSPRLSHTDSSPNVSNIGSTSSSANVVTEPAEANDSQRLHSEVESLRREMERLRAQGLIIEAPPSYTEGDR